ncbi:MAG TPA: hypothetical protein VKU38_16300 [Ktedonobacteraceae bacterium]|nr:hypothetical protein [Ktedonobacteraceae bacterium]
MAIFQPNILIQSHQGYPIAVVEVKNRQNLSPDVAAAFRRNMLVHGLLSKTPFFLLTSQDTGFLWKEAKEENFDALPDYEFSMDKVVSRYIKQKPGERLYEPVLDLVVFQWLLDLTMDMQKPLEEPERTLTLAGFNESIKGAKIIAEEIQ